MNPIVIPNQRTTQKRKSSFSKLEEESEKKIRVRDSKISFEMNWCFKNVLDLNENEYEESDVFELKPFKDSEDGAYKFSLRVYKEDDFDFFTATSRKKLSIYIASWNLEDVVVDYNLYWTDKSNQNMKISSEKDARFKKQIDGKCYQWGQKDCINLTDQYLDMVTGMFLGSPYQFYQRLSTDNRTRLTERLSIAEIVKEGKLNVGCDIIFRSPILPTTVLDEVISSRSTMNEDCKKWFGNREKWSDFEIKCGPNYETSFKCHKMMLAMRSKVFEAMLAHENTTEVRDNFIKVIDFSSGSIEKLLHFIYTDEVNKEEVDTELLSLADYFEIERLKAICEKHLLEGITLDNAASLSISAYLQGSDEFEQEVFRYMKKHWRKIKSSNDFEKIKQYPEVLIKIIDFYDNLEDDKNRK